jgi:hypothetical protein
VETEYMEETTMSKYKNKQTSIPQCSRLNNTQPLPASPSYFSLDISFCDVFSVHLCYGIDEKHENAL